MSEKPDIKKLAETFQEVDARVLRLEEDLSNARNERTEARDAMLSAMSRYEDEF